MITAARILGVLLLVGGIVFTAFNAMAWGSYQFFYELRHFSRGTPIMIGTVVAGAMLLVASFRQKPPNP